MWSFPLSLNVIKISVISFILRIWFREIPQECFVEKGLWRLLLKRLLPLPNIPLIVELHPSLPSFSLFMKLLYISKRKPFSSLSGPILSDSSYILLFSVSKYLFLVYLFFIYLYLVPTSRASHVNNLIAESCFCRRVTKATHLVLRRLVHKLGTFKHFWPWGGTEQKTL